MATHSRRRATLDFYLPQGIIAGQTILNVAGTANISNSTIRIGIDGSGTSLSALANGERVTLIDAHDTLTASGIDGTNATAMSGVSLSLPLKLSVDSTWDDLLLTVGEASPPPPPPPQQQSMSMWTDTVLVVSENGKWKVDDILFQTVEGPGENSVKQILRRFSDLHSCSVPR